MESQTVQVENVGVKIKRCVAWYVLYGGMQDWNYLYVSDFEITIELSMDKYPSANQLPDYWNQNREAMVAYLMLVHTGVKGRCVLQIKNQHVIRSCCEFVYESYKQSDCVYR